MPLKLKGVLIRHGISNAVLAGEIRQAGGKPLSRSAVNLIINHGYFPKNTEPHAIKGQIGRVLEARGVPDAEISTAWEPEGSDRYRSILPAGTFDDRVVSPRTRKSPTEQPDFQSMEIQMLSSAAKRHFKLIRDPFQDDVNSPDDVYLSESQRYVTEAMLQTALLGGITAVIGESGSGKTTLRKLLQHRISRERQTIRVIFPHTLDKTKLSTGAICTAIVKDLEPETTLRSSLEAQARQVKDVLLRSSRAGFKHLLMIEEAHDLSIQTLKYLKRFYEIESDDGFGKVLAIVLVAQPEMRVKLDVARHPEAREFINRCEIATLDPLQQQVGPYLAHKLARLGLRAEEVFSPDAYDAIRDRWTKIDPATRAVKTNLYPLIVNNTATRAMNRAAELGLPLVTGDLIKEL